MCLYICFCEVQLSCTNSLYLMQLDFKLKKKKEKKIERNEKEPFMHYLPFPALLELSTNVYSVNISACPAQCLHTFFFSPLVSLLL